MNVYWVYSDGVWTAPRYDPPEPPDCVDVYEIVVAETPGQAKFAALRNQRYGWPGEYTDLRVRLVKRGIPDSPGVYTNQGNFYSREICQMHHKVRTCEFCPDYTIDCLPCRD